MRETEGLDFAQAVEWLADRTGIQLEYEETSPAQEARRKRRDRLESLLEDAASFYSRYLWDTTAGEPVRAYLAERGLTEEVCRDFRLGLSPGGDRLAVKAREKGYSQDELLAAGLVNRRGNDYFAGRLVFPLSNARGRVLGFGARRLHDDDPIKAKYVNSPEGELFRKSRIVYGLHRARAAIAKQDEAVVVEGYTDVLALHQRGRNTVVASMGTALTEEQLKELGHLTKRLFLCFDADAAGEAATLRGMDLAAARGFQVRVVPLPAGVDPADAADSFDELLTGAVGYLRHRAEAEIKQGDSRQEQFLRVQGALAGLPDSPDREEAVRYAADKLGLSPDMQAGLAPRAQRKTGAVSDRALEGGDRLERRLLAAVAADPELVEHYLAPLDERHFDDPLHQRLRAYLCGEADADDELLRARAELDATAETEHLDADTARALPPARGADGAPRAGPPRGGGLGPNRRATDSSDQDTRGSAGGLGHRSLKSIGRSPVAQLAEHPAVNRRVVGSSPTRGAWAAQAARVDCLSTIPANQPVRPSSTSLRTPSSRGCCWVTRPSTIAAAPTMTWGAQKLASSSAKPKIHGDAMSTMPAAMSNRLCTDIGTTRNTPSS